MIALRDKALELSKAWVGRREEGKNRGYWPELVLKNLGRPPGESYCMAWVIQLYDDAAAATRLINPLPRTPGVAKMWARSKTIWKSHLPTVGSIFIHLNDPADPFSPGHTGIVIGIETDAIATREGNTNPLGSRDGDGWYERTRPKRGYVNMGYVDVGRFGPDDLPRVA